MISLISPLIDFEDDADTLSAGVLDDIGDRLLQDAEQGRFDIRRQAAVAEPDLKVDVQARQFGPFLEILRDGVPQAQFIQRHRSEFPRHSAEIPTQFGGQLLEFRKALSRGRTAGAARCDGVQTEQQRGQVLSQPVVQFAGDAGAFVLLCRNDLVQQVSTLLVGGGKRLGEFAVFLFALAQFPSGLVARFRAAMQLLRRLIQRACDRVDFLDAGRMRRQTLATPHRVGVTDQAAD